MPDIYDQNQDKLSVLLEEASSDRGATLLIPDLQRPYVWGPKQVSLLMDSLIRGWPFGTLLLWKVKSDALSEIPNRAFWKVVDRTDEASSERISKQTPPAQFRMVLDGQQRLQSLLLALGGDGWGFRMFDREWFEVLHERRSRGRQGTKHWSLASLSFDLLSFLAECQLNKRIVNIDYDQNVLKWVVHDIDGLSRTKRPEGYIYPCELANNPENKGRFIRLSKLWNLAEGDSGLKEDDFKERLRPCLEELGVSASVLSDLLKPLSQFMTTFDPLKLIKISFLELSPYKPSLGDRDSYNDAVVSIFTRLNTAGRTLTPEEITFAWIKVGWKQDQSRETAVQAVTKLQEELKEKQVDLETDKLIAAASIVWAANFKNGEVLSNRDLLKGDTIRPMAQQFSENWGGLYKSAILAAESLQARGLALGQQYSSVNAFALIWAIVFAAEHWQTSHSMKATEADSFAKLLQEALSTNLDRWIICSQWAGRWSEGTRITVAKYAKELASDLPAITAAADFTQVAEILRRRLEAWVLDIKQDAITEIENMKADRRDQVGLYTTALWVWHRLDAERWKMSKIQLRDMKAKKVRHEVDHIISVKLWNEKAEGEQVDAETAQEIMNLIGNTFLLEKTFNISKSDRTLKVFLENVHEFKNGTIKIEDWAAPLLLESEHVDAEQVSLAVLQSHVENRTVKMKTELKNFVSGHSTRKDV